MNTPRVRLQNRAEKFGHFLSTKKNLLLTLEYNFRALAQLFQLKKNELTRNAFYDNKNLNEIVIFNGSI